MAFVLPLAVGIAALAVTGVRAARHDTTGLGLYFIIGLASGYLVPLSVRVARMIGPDRVSASRALQALVMGLTFLGLLGPFFVAALVPGHMGEVLQAAASGTIAMAALGTALQDDAPERVAA